MQRFFVTPASAKKSVSKTEESLKKPSHESIESVIKQLNIFNGNYLDLLNDKICNTTFINEKFNFYLNRFLNLRSAWFSLGGDNLNDVKNLIDSCTFIKLKNQTPFHTGLVIDIYNNSILVKNNSLCMFYFVNTYNELITIHQKTTRQIENIHQNFHHTIPSPPIILIIQNEKSPLLNKDNLKNCNIPILDIWKVQTIKFSKNSATKIINTKIWESFLHKLTLLYQDLAVKRGLLSESRLTPAKKKEVVKESAGYKPC